MARTLHESSRVREVNYAFDTVFKTETQSIVFEWLCGGYVFQHTISLQWMNRIELRFDSRKVPIVHEFRPVLHRPFHYQAKQPRRELTTQNAKFSMAIKALSSL
jgi:hypothetical protein